MKNLFGKLKVDKRIRVGYGTAFLLLLISYLLTLYANRELLKQAGRVVHTNQVIAWLEATSSSMKDAETGYHGFLLARDTSFLEPYRKSIRITDSTYSLLKGEMSDPVQQERLKALHNYITIKFNLIGTGLLHFERNSWNYTDSLRNLIFMGKAAMDSIRSSISVLETAERQSLEKRTENMRSSFTALDAIIITSLVIAFLLLVFGFLTYARENKARREAVNQVDAYQAQLQARVDELAIANNKLIEMRSEEKFAATGRIARTIAHEVRNPLTNINLALDQLRTDIPSIDENAAYLFDMISRNATRINQLISDLLSSTKFAELNQEIVPVNDLIDGALEQARDRIALSEVKVEKNLASPSCSIYADRQKMQIALLNIIVNALEAMEAGKGVLTITTKISHQKCSIEIKDNGPGIDKETQAKLFEPYFTSKQKGNGLGLTNTQNIILNHKGTIEVESEGVGGSAFTIHLDTVR